MTPGKGRPGGEQLGANHHRKHSADKEEREDRRHVHEADALMIERKQPGLNTLAMGEVIVRTGITAAVVEWHAMRNWRMNCRHLKTPGSYSLKSFRSNISVAVIS